MAKNMMPRNPEVPDWPADFDDEQLAKLRILTRYVIGCSSPQRVFPTPEMGPGRGRTDAQKAGRNAATIAATRFCGKLTLTKDQIDNFKNGEAIAKTHGLTESELERLKQIYCFVWLYWREEPSKHAELSSLFDGVYNKRSQQHTNRFQTFAEAIYAQAGISTHDLVKYQVALVGGYYLYRYGTSGDLGTPEIVRSIARVTLIQKNGYTRLRVSVCYKAGEQKKLGELQTIEGVAVPHRAKLFIAGVDDGTGSSPCLMITKLPSHRVRVPQIPGVLLRLNTLEHTAATRIMLIRKTTVQEEQSSMALDKWFHGNASAAALFTMEQAKNDAEIVKIVDLIENNVPGHSKFMLTGL